MRSLRRSISSGGPSSQAQDKSLNLNVNFHFKKILSVCFQRILIEDAIK